MNPNARTKLKKEVYQPPEIEVAWSGMEKMLAENEMTLDKQTPIAYGRQIRVKTGLHWAELNIFYGKKGFSVVKTTKTGSNETLAELAATALKFYLEDLS